VKTANYILFLAVIAFAAVDTFAQKVKVGYDKGTDFSRYKTYTWQDPGMPAAWPVLYEAVVARTDVELRSRGLMKVANHGDLALIPSGGVDFGFSGQSGTPYLPTYGGPPPTVNATMWTGANGPSTVGIYVPEGTLILTFVDRSSNKTVWSGSVKQKLDHEQKHKSLELADKAVIKLLTKFPGRK
jgi:hypothetical protein